MSDRRAYTPPLDVKTAEWWNARRSKFEALWQAGHSASQIGLALGVSKNAVIGKAGRWGLPKRATPGRHHVPGSPRQRNSRYERNPSAIKMKPSAPRPPRPPRAPTPRPVPELPPLAVCEPPVAASTPPAAVCVPTAPQKPPAAPLVAYSPFKTCQNIPGEISEGYGLDFRVLFCGAAVTTPGPYCDDCRRINFRTLHPAMRGNTLTRFVPRAYVLSADREMDEPGS